MARLVVGCGYLGSRVAQRWASSGDETFVLTRSPARAHQLAQLGLQPLVGDVTEPGSLPALPEVDTLLWSVGHDRQASQSIHEVYVDGLRNLLEVLPGLTHRIIYISSTGVYGECDGSWVDESSPCRPQRAGGAACWAAEQLLLNSPWASRTVVLRLAGIYGPRRLPRLKQLQAGEPLATAPAGLLNLIHVDDAAQAVMRAAAAQLHLPRCYLIADGNPVPRHAFYKELARLFQTPEPVFGTISDERGERRGSRGHKRVANTRMLAELGVVLAYPSYRAGLATLACLS